MRSERPHRAVPSRSVSRARPTDDLPAADAGAARRRVRARRVRGRRGARPRPAHARRRTPRSGWSSRSPGRTSRSAPTSSAAGTSGCSRTRACSASTSPTSSPPTRAPRPRPRRPPSRSCCRPTRSTSWSGSSTTPRPSPSSRSWSRPRSCCSSRARSGCRRHAEGAHRLRLAHVLQRPAAGGAAGRPAGPVRRRATASTSWRRPTTRAPRRSRASRWPFESGGGRIAGTARLTPGTASQRTITLIKRREAEGDVLRAGHRPTPSRSSRQYAQAGLATTIPLYGSGPITEGNVLVQEGQAATGVQSTLHYSDQLATPENTAFVTAYKARLPGRPELLRGARATTPDACCRTRSATT